MSSQKRARIEDEMEEVPRMSKSRACNECKKHKIKCERKPGDSSCARCYKQGHKCIINSHFQRVIEEDSEWKKAAAAQIGQLQAAVSGLLHHSQLPGLSNYGTSTVQNKSPDTRMGSGPSPDTGSTMAMTRENSQEPETESELVSAPMRSLYEVTKLRNLRSNLYMQPPKVNRIEEDFISRGVLPLDQAEKLFAVFDQNMNQFLWGGIALKHLDLSSVRRSSSLLSAAILAVASLHVPDKNEIFETCYSEFITLVSSSTLNRYHTLDEIRGLCIGAFWLSDLSWKLSGHAIRVATEMNLHRSLHKSLSGDLDHFERAQLWYFLYLCDHHFSIAYGRPPVIYETSAITNYEAYLQSPSAGPGDVRMVAQVALFVILAKGFVAFGSGIEQALEEADFDRLRALTVDIETWRMHWQPRSGMADIPYIGTYPSKGVVLHYHFAKFQLNSLSLRAITPNSHLSMDRKDAAHLAISSAMSTLDFILHEPDIRSSIVGVPLYTHTMVAFCAVFLLKVAWKWNSPSLNIDKRQVRDLVLSVIEVMSSVAASKKHLAYHIASGLSKMLERLQDRSINQIEPVSGTRTSASNAAMGVPLQEPMFDTLDIYGFEFDDAWNDFPTSLDFFPT